MTIIDTHAHLADLKLIKDLNGVIQRAKKENVSKIVSIGCSEEEVKKSVKIAEKYDGVYSTAGIYPHEDIDISNPQKKINIRLKDIERLAKQQKIIAIGECGLDYNKSSDREHVRNKKDQKDLFIKQISLAKGLALPLIVHSRYASKDTLEILQAEISNNTPKVLWHCYTENAELAQTLVDMGITISFSGIATYTNAEDVRTAVKSIPIQNIVLETDAPYLTPKPIQKMGISINEPQYVKIVAQKIADIKGLSFESVLQNTTKNALNFFNI